MKKKFLSQNCIKSILSIALCTFITISLTCCCPAADKLAHYNDKKESQNESNNNTYNSSDNNNSSEDTNNSSEDTKKQNSNSNQQKEETKSLGSIVKATITKIVDGDTYYVSCYDTRIRLIGIDCPEADTVEGDLATNYVNTNLPVGTTVWLESDVDDCDIYGRPLRYVWTKFPGNTGAAVTKSDVGSKMFNAKLLKDGQATAKQYIPNTKYADWFNSF